MLRIYFIFMGIWNLDPPREKMGQVLRSWTFVKVFCLFFFAYFYAETFMPETISSNNNCLKSEHLHIIFFTNHDLCSFSFSVFFLLYLLYEVGPSSSPNFKYWSISGRKRFASESSGAVTILQKKNEELNEKIKALTVESAGDLAKISRLENK